MTNEHKADRAYRAILAYYNAQNMETSIITMLTDLMHLAPQYGLNTDDLFSKAKTDFLNEIKNQ
jgi:hypothetical protein